MARPLGRIALRRVAAPRPLPRPPVHAPPTMWSRGLWGLFLPDRRRGGDRPRHIPERRRR